MLNISFPVRNCAPTHWWHILNWIAKINKVVTKVSLNLLFEAWHFWDGDSHFPSTEGKKKPFYLQLNRERNEGNITTLGNVPSNVAHPCKTQALRNMWLIPDGASFKYLILDPLLYWELPVIWRGKQYREFFQHIQILTIFLFFTIRIQCEG